jgi:hypothetical protein
MCILEALPHVPSRAHTSSFVNAHANAAGWCLWTCALAGLNPTRNSTHVIQVLRRRVCTSPGAYGPRRARRARHARAPRVPRWAPTRGGHDGASLRAHAPSRHGPTTHAASAWHGSWGAAGPAGRGAWGIWAVGPWGPARRSQCRHAKHHHGRRWPARHDDAAAAAAAARQCHGAPRGGRFISGARVWGRRQQRG